MLKLRRVNVFLRYLKSVSHEINVFSRQTSPFVRNLSTRRLVLNLSFIDLFKKQLLNIFTLI